MGHYLSTDAPPGMAMYASEGVLAAMAAATISRGHASLLCALRPGTQEGALKALLALPSLPGVEDLMRGIEAKAVALPKAAFNQDDCGKCRFNSTNHAQLFGTSIEPGMCVNSECATSKWETHLEQLREQLAAKHRIIRIAPVSQHEHFRSVVPEGPFGLGQEQARACREECQEFGAVLCGTVSTPTYVLEDVCTNMACHVQKVELARKEGLLASRDRLWRAALVQHLSLLPRATNRAVLMAMLSCGWSAPRDLRAAADLDEQATPAGVLKRWLSMAESELIEHLAGAAGKLVAGAPAHQVGEMLRALHVRLQDYSSMSREFLKRLSVSEIDEVLGDLNVPVSEELRRAKRAGQEAYAAAAMASVSNEMLDGYVPRMFRY